MRSEIAKTKKRLAEKQEELLEQIKQQVSIKKLCRRNMDQSAFFQGEAALEDRSTKLPIPLILFQISKLAP